MSKAKKIGLVGLVVLGMLVAVPVVAAEAGDSTPASTKSAEQNRGGSTIFDIFTMSPEQFVNAMNSNAND